MHVSQKEQRLVLAAAEIGLVRVFMNFSLSVTNYPVAENYRIHIGAVQANKVADTMTAELATAQ